MPIAAYNGYYLNKYTVSFFYNASFFIFDAKIIDINLKLMTVAKPFFHWIKNLFLHCSNYISGEKKHC